MQYAVWSAKSGLRERDENAVSSVVASDIDGDDETTPRVAKPGMADRGCAVSNGQVTFFFSMLLLLMSLLMRPLAEITPVLFLHRDSYNVFGLLRSGPYSVPPTPVVNYFLRKPRRARRKAGRQQMSDRTE